MAEARFFLTRDDSGHWYCVPLEQKEEFDRLLERIENDTAGDADWNRWSELFEPCGLEMHFSCYSFTDWREDPS